MSNTRSAQKFIVKDPNVTKYFPLTSNTEIIEEAFTPRSASRSIALILVGCRAVTIAAD